MDKIDSSDIGDQNYCDITTSSDNIMEFDSGVQDLDVKENILKDPLNSFSPEGIEDMKEKALIPGLVSVQIKRDKSVERRINFTSKKAKLPTKDSPTKKRKISCDLMSKLDNCNMSESPTKKNKETENISQNQSTNTIPPKPPGPGRVNNKGKTGKAIKFFIVY